MERSVPRREPAHCDAEVRVCDPDESLFEEGI